MIPTGWMEREEDSLAKRVVEGVISGDLPESNEGVGIKEFKEFLEEDQTNIFSISRKWPGSFAPSRPLDVWNGRKLEERVKKRLSEVNILYSKLLNGYMSRIGDYFYEKGKEYDLNVTLQEDPEEADFWSIIIIIETDFEGIDEKLGLIDEIGEELNKEIDALSRRFGNLHNLSSPVTFLLRNKGKNE